MQKGGRVWQGAAMYDYRGIPVFAEPGVHEGCEELILSRRPPPAKVLDIAAGSGAFTRRLLDRGYDVSANDLDCSRWAVDAVRPTSVDLNGAFASSFREKYDVVAALEIIEHLENPAHFLRECRKLLLPGGILLLSVPNVIDYDSRYMHLRHGEFYHFNPRNLKIGHISILPCWLVEWHAEREGYAVVERRFVGRKTHRGLRKLQHWLFRHLLRPIMWGGGGGALKASCVAYVLRPDGVADAG